VAERSLDGNSRTTHTRELQAVSVRRLEILWQHRMSRRNITSPSTESRASNENENFKAAGNAAMNVAGAVREMRKAVENPKTEEEVDDCLECLNEELQSGRLGPREVREPCTGGGLGASAQPPVRAPALCVLTDALSLLRSSARNSCRCGT
jgi:hypothetical protein